MTDQTSPTAVKTSKKKRRGIVKLVSDLIKRPKSANDSASQSKSTRVFISASGAHDPVPGTDAGSAEPMASTCGNATGLNQDPTAPFQTGRPRSSSVQELPSSIVGQGDGGHTSYSSTPAAGPKSSNSQIQSSDWKATANENLKVAGRFAQTLLKRLPECTDWHNPVKMALSIVRMIIEIKDAVGGNKDELARGLQETQATLQAVERTVANSVPEVVRQDIENFKQYIVFTKWYIMMNTSPSRNIRNEMKNLEELTNKPVTQILDYEEYTQTIVNIFQRVNGATKDFQLTMVISIQKKASEIHDYIKSSEGSPK